MEFRYRRELSPPFLVLLTLTLLATTAMRAQDNIDTSNAGACKNATDPCVATYHNDNARDGVQSNEAVLSPTLFTTIQSNSNFGLLGATPLTGTGALDGLLYAQPLYLSGVAVNTTSCPTSGGPYNLVLVATENNSVYAFTWTYTLTSSGHTFSLTQCWKSNFNQSGEFAIPFTALPVDPSTGSPCSNVVPESGITSTPVIDTSVTPPVMYVVTADQKPGSPVSYTYRIHAILVSSGAEASGGNSPYDLSGVFPTGLSPTQENQRPGLAMFKPSQGKANLYVSFGSFCDVAPYSGYVAGLTFTYGGTPAKTFSHIAASNWVFDSQPTHTDQAGGVWMSGAAPAVDSNGNIYIASEMGTGTAPGMALQGREPPFSGRAQSRLQAAALQS